MFSGCARQNKPCFSAGKDDNSVTLTETRSTSDDSGYTVEAIMSPMDEGSLNPALLDDLAEEWDEYDSLTDSQRLLSSHSYGQRTRNFSTWAEAEDFVGFPVANPYENNDSFLRNAVYEHRLNERQTGDVSVTFFGTREHVSCIWLSTEYTAADGARVDFSARLCTDDNIPYMTGHAWASYVTFEHEEYTSGEISALVVKPLNIKNYDSADAYFVRGSILYTVHVTVDADADAADALTDALDAFDVSHAEQN